MGSVPGERVVGPVVCVAVRLPGPLGHAQPTTPVEEARQRSDFPAIGDVVLVLEDLFADEVTALAKHLGVVLLHATEGVDLRIVEYDGIRRLVVAVLLQLQLDARLQRVLEQRELPFGEGVESHLFGQVVLVHPPRGQIQCLGRVVRTTHAPVSEEAAVLHQPAAQEELLPFRYVHASEYDLAALILEGREWRGALVALGADVADYGDADGEDDHEDLPPVLAFVDDLEDVHAGS